MSLFITPSITSDIYTVSRLNQETQLLLANHFRTIWVQGEISNLTKATSGHYYFSLKDNHAQIRCAYFRNRHGELFTELVNGMQVIAYATVSLYAARGDYQLIIEQLQAAGAGLLQLEFEKLKAKLAQQGLFEDKFKQPLPTLPRCIGVITSPRGAAILDILTTLKKRFCAIAVIIYPTEVQGKNAAAKIVEAINLANTRDECEVLIVARGGGSLEDLWPFNEEIVARAIFASKLPIVTGIGHQTDRSIADFVADLATATPTAAAAAVCPNYLDWQQQLLHLLSNAQHALERKLHNQHKCLLALINKLEQKNPQTQLNRVKHRMLMLKQQLKHAITHQLNQQRQQLAGLVATLNAVSPLATLERGYALALTQQQQLIRSVQQVKLGDDIIVKLFDSQLICQVQEVVN